MIVNNRVYLLYTDYLKYPDIFSFYYQKMSSERREKIDAFRFDKDKRLSLGAGMLLRYVLENRQEEGKASKLKSREEPDPIILSYGEYGKPYLKDSDRFFFNLSHSGQMAVCACSDCPVGADTEENRHFTEELIRYVFLPEDIGIADNMNINPDSAFTLMWTIKESIMKQQGKGVGLAPKRIRIKDIEKTGSGRSEEATYTLYRSRAEITDEEKGSDGTKSCRDMVVTSWSLPGYQVSVCSDSEEEFQLCRLPAWDDYGNLNL